MNNQKGFSPILVLVGILIIIAATGGAYLFGKSQAPKSQTPQSVTSASPAPIGTREIANWKTYTDSKNLFSIKYPSNLYVKGGGQQFFLAKQAAASAEVNDYSDQLVEINLGDALNRFESYYNTSDHLLVKGYSDLKLRNYLIDGNKAVEYGYDETEKEKELKQNEEAIKSGADVAKIYFNRGLIINKDKTIIEISTPFYNGDFKNTFDQILSTFKFLDQKQDGESGIIGKVVLGPSCPVVRPGVNDECQDKPYQATIAVKTADGAKEVTRFTSDSAGNFKVSLAPGDYLLEAVSNNRFPFAKPQSTMVAKGEFTSVTISFDTGIR